MIKSDVRKGQGLEGAIVVSFLSGYQSNQTELSVEEAEKLIFQIETVLRETRGNENEGDIQESH